MENTYSARISTQKKKKNKDYIGCTDNTIATA